MKARKAVAALGATAAMILANAPTAHRAAAAPADGPYLRLEAGGLFPSGGSVSNTTGPDLRIAPNDAPTGGAAAGLRLTPFRLEVEGLWMRSATSANANGISGHLTNIPAMANVYFDIDTGGKLEPYIGLGVGASFVSLKGATASAGQINSSTRVLAFQPIVGVNYNMTDQISVGLQYRYFKTADASFGTASGQRFSFSNSAHVVLATLTYHFFARQAKAAEAASNAAPPNAIREPVPALGLALAPSAQPEPQMYLVFFDFDSAKLTAAGRRAADEVVIAYRQDPTSAIVVRGYTDLVGTDEYNLALSKRRAMTVYDYFVAQGVKPADMGVDWQGKANPRVPTPKEEPQNRRVEIQM
jgi:outer membrane protein OmpA-like peptidoglycan-associated protein